jgi:hypothetical protein
MRRRGATEAEILAALVAMNARCVPPLSDDELSAIAHSVARYEPAPVPTARPHVESSAQNVEPQGHDTPLENVPQWPAPLSPAAFPGLVGEIIRTLEPQTEADPAALLGHLLVMFGSCVGRGPHFVVEGTRHHTNLFALLVGPTAKGRKGTAEGQIRRLFGEVDDEWVRDRIVGGLVSGEGLVWHVRDPIVQAKRKDGIETQETVDPGVTDKRLLVLETEYAATLRVMNRDTSTLGATVRQAWDRGELATLGKQNPARATGAHISIMGHITAEELRAELRTTDAANGFLNRHLLFMVRRARILPEGGHLEDAVLGQLRAKLLSRVLAARQRGKVTRDADARALWAQVYDGLSEGRPGLLGAVIGRAEPQVLRLSLLYALLDGSREITPTHLKAALEVWRYCADSARFVFGERLGVPLADHIAGILQSHRNGITRTALHEVLGRNRRAEDISAALLLLAEYGRAEQVVEDTGGRPAERWYPGRGATKETKKGVGDGTN